MVRDLLTKEDYMIRINLKDAYLVIPDSSAMPPFSMFLLGDQDYKFVCLSFGLAWWW